MTTKNTKHGMPASDPATQATQEPLGPMNEKTTPNQDGKSDHPPAAQEDALPEPARAERAVEVKVGAFVVLTLVAAVAIVLTLAQKRHVFERRVVIHTRFQDVQGLKEGAPVRLSGVNIGLVSRIAFAREKTASVIHVDMEIGRDSLERIGADSVVRIGTQGLLGDKIVELAVTENPGQPIKAGASLESQPPADFNKIVEQASHVLAKAEVVAERAAGFMEGVADPKSLANIRGIIQSVQGLTQAAEEGPGLVHAMFYSAESTRSFQSLLARVDQLAGHVDSAIEHVDQVLGNTDDDGVELINNLSRAAKSVGEVAGDVHESRLVPHLDQASGDLAAMTAYARSGQGTVGMALMDPTVYEQLVSVLGGVARSRVLRALVRYAIQKDDGQKVGAVVDEPAVQEILRTHSGEIATPAPR